MSQGSLTSLFSPRSVAIVGASDRPESVGGAVLKNMRSCGFTGPVYAVNRQHRMVQGQPAYASLRDLPAVPELAVFCTAAETIPDLITECGQLGVGAAIVISAGFREIGPDGRALETELKSRLRDYPRLRMIGPNCLGILRPSSGLNASFSAVMPRAGRMTLLTQSGALGTAIMDWANQRDLGFATCVSVGNMVDVVMGELIEYFAGDEETDAILLYLEGLARAENFVAAAQACTRRKPVIAFKAGRFEESSRAAASHTGAMASADAVYDAAFRRAGIERVHSIDELFDCAGLLAGQRHAVGNRLAVITNAGGPGIMASDAWLSCGGRLAELTTETLTTLNQVLPTCWSHGNPVDVLGDAPADRYRDALRAVLADPGVDALLVILTPQMMTDARGVAEIIVGAQRQSSKTIVAAFLGGDTVESGREVLRRGRIPVYDFPEGAAQALHHLVAAGERQHRSPVKINLSSPIAPDRVAFWRGQLSQRASLVDEVSSKRMLEECGVPIVPTIVAGSADEAARAADQMGYPVVIKVLSPDISHKTDVGGVLLNLANAEQVHTGYDRMWESMQQRAPHARWEGVTVQPMISSTRGVELLLGMKRDPQFGPVFLLGAGGITAELQKDSVLELAPLDEELCARMLRRLRLYPLLEGYRGRPGVNLPALQQAIRNFSQSMPQFPELGAAEINPLLVTADRVIALDARLIVESSHGS